MQVTIILTAQLRAAAGAPQRSIAVSEGADVNDAIGRLADELGPAFHKAICAADAQLHPSLLVFVDEEPARGDTPLHDGAEITILSPIAGGR